MTSKRPKASIIIPAHNTELYIGRALSCAAAQTERDIQIVVVDDGSTDGTLDIARRYAELDSRFEVIHVENGGVSRARNIGIDHACGEKLFFLDSDDEFSAELVHNCLNFAGAHDVSSVLYGFSNQTDAGKGTPFPHELKMEYRGDDVICELLPRFVGHSYADICNWVRGDRGLREGKEHTALWRIMLDAGVVRNNGMRFNEALDLGEDTIFINTYFSFEKSVGFLDECLYWLTARIGSLNWTSNNDPVLMARNKLKIMEEKNLLAQSIACKTDLDIRPFYAGTQVLSALQLCLELGRNRTVAPRMRANILSEYLGNDTVYKCIEDFVPPLAFRSIPFFALKTVGGLPIMHAVALGAKLGVVR